MPSRISSGPPLPSRAVLAIGGLTLLCLTLVTALLFAADADGEERVRLDAPVAGAAHLQAAPVATPPEEPAVPRTVYAAEPEPIPAGVLAALEQSAEEPLETELARLLDALQYGFGESSVEVEPTLRPYAFRLAGRLNVRGGAFRIRVGAYDGALARQRAETLARLFEAAGVAPGRLQFQPRTGAPGLAVESPASAPAAADASALGSS